VVEKNCLDGLETHSAGAIVALPPKIVRANQAGQNPKLQDPQVRYPLAVTRQAFRPNR
jgi:hypothetical protein